MKDDIATRLRLHALEGCSVADWTLLSWDIQVAADAIEHLTAKCKHLEAEVSRLERLSNG